MSTLLKKSDIVRIEIYNLLTRQVQFKDQKKPKPYSIVKTELSLSFWKLYLSFWKCPGYVL